MNSLLQTIKSRSLFLSKSRIGFYPFNHAVPGCFGYSKLFSSNSGRGIPFSRNFPSQTVGNTPIHQNDGQNMNNAPPTFGNPPRYQNDGQNMNNIPPAFRNPPRHQNDGSNMNNIPPAFGNPPRHQNYGNNMNNAPPTFGNFPNLQNNGNNMNNAPPTFGNFPNLQNNGNSMTNTPSPFGNRLNYENNMDNVQPGRNPREMDFVRGLLEDNSNDIGGRYGGTEQNPDVVHIKMIRNNTFVTVTDSKGNKKLGASSGCLAEMKGGPKVSKYASEATAEHIGRLSRNLGLKSVVMKVNGFTYFKKKKQAIMSWREGYTYSKGDLNPIVYVEDTTRRAHNGCRLPKKRRV